MTQPRAAGRDEGVRSANNHLLGDNGPQEILCCWLTFNRRSERAVWSNSPSRIDTRARERVYAALRICVAATQPKVIEIWERFYGRRWLLLAANCNLRHCKFPAQPKQIYPAAEEMYPRGQSRQGANTMIISRRYKNYKPSKQLPK